MCDVTFLKRSTRGSHIRHRLKLHIFFSIVIVCNCNAYTKRFLSQEHYSFHAIPHKRITGLENILFIVINIDTSSSGYEQTQHVSLKYGNDMVHACYTAKVHKTENKTD